MLTGQIGNLIFPAHGKDSCFAAAVPLRRDVFQIETMIGQHLTFDKAALAEVDTAPA